MGILGQGSLRRASLELGSPVYDAIWSGSRPRKLQNTGRHKFIKND